MEQGECVKKVWYIYHFLKVISGRWFRERRDERGRKKRKIKQIIHDKKRKKRGKKCHAMSMISITVKVYSMEEFDWLDQLVAVLEEH